MLSDDVFKTQLRATVAGLEAWLATLRHLATVDIAHDEASWRASVAPHVPQACPFELILRIDQRFDMAIGSETFEDQPIATLASFLPLLTAITDGRVITRLWSTAATATAVRVETIVSPVGGAPWSRARQLAAAHTYDADGLILRDRHYAPYARGA